MSNIHHYVADPEVRRLSWQSRLAHPAWTADPNEGHLALVALERYQDALAGAEQALALDATLVNASAARDQALAKIRSPS